MAEPATSAAIGRCGASEAGRCCDVSPFHCFTVSPVHSPPSFLTHPSNALFPFLRATSNVHGILNQGSCSAPPTEIKQGCTKAGKKSCRPPPPFLTHPPSCPSVKPPQPDEGYPARAHGARGGARAPAQLGVPLPLPRGGGLRVGELHRRVVELPRGRDTREG